MVRESMKKVVAWILVFVITFLSTGTVSALSSERLGKYSNYQIYFFDPDEDCVPSSLKNPFTGGEEEWDGSCSTMDASKIAWLQKYLSGMQEAASKNGIPWELVPAQTFQESGGGKKEVCDNNPLGLKAIKGHASCSNGFAKFNSHEEAFDYYMNHIISIRELKGKYPDDPYSAVAFIQYGASHPYASCDNDKIYPQCVGHMYEPTPGYVKSVSSLICGIQKWAESEGIKTSAVTWRDYSPSNSGGTTGGEEEEEEEEENVVYCDDDEYEEPEAGNLVSFIKSWAWPDYHSPVYTQRMPAYAEYMDNVATYHPSGGVDCGAFVANIMKASGWDPNYVQAGTSSQATYLSSNWEKVSVNSLRLGDVGIKSGHVILYVGNIPGFHSRTASASANERAPMAGGDSAAGLNNYTWYRKK